jgi:hypothetical protein
VPTGFKFTLYKYGPFSFDLRDKLTEMRSSGQLEMLVQPAPYGPQLDTGPGADQLRKRFPKTLLACASAKADRFEHACERWSVTAYLHAVPRGR